MLVRLVGSQASLCDQLIPRRLCANSSFTGEIGEQFNLRRLCATNWFSGYLVRLVGSHKIRCVQSGLIRLSTTS